MYAARTSDKRGRKRHETFAESREQAAKLVFEADPKAKECSTAKAHNGWDTGNDIKWHKREDFPH